MQQNLREIFRNKASQKASSAFCRGKMRPGKGGGIRKYILKSIPDPKLVTVDTPHGPNTKFVWKMWTFPFKPKFIILLN